VSRMRRSRQGFTLVELMIVIIILGVLATIAMAFFANLTTQARISAMDSDLESAYKAAVAYFVDHPGGVVDEAGLLNYGYSPTDDVQIAVTDGNEDTLVFTATHTKLPGTTCQINNRGEITH